MAVDRTIKVLLVEDSKITRKMEIKALNELGYHNVVEVDDGDSAIAKLGQERDIRLIISDWNMPGKDGYELLKWVRSNAGSRDIPFIMATARGEKKETAKAVEAGVTNLIAKPFGPGELDAIIEDCFKDKKEREAQAAPQQWEARKAESGKLLLNVAHIQITDHITLGALKHMISVGKLSPESFELETRCMPGWNPVQKALETGEVDAAFILAPIAMDLFGFGTPIKLVLLAHKNGSICVQKKRAKGEQQSLQQFFRNKSFYIPHTMSIHHMLVHRFLREVGLNPGVRGQVKADVFFEVVPPIKMIEFLGGTPDACGFMVAEPMGTKAIAEGVADLLFLSGELWENHPCCVLAVRDEVIQNFPNAVQELTNMLVQAGEFVYKRPDSAAEIGVSFLDPNKTLGLKVPILKNVLKEAKGIRTNDLFPLPEDFEKIQEYMVKEMGIGTGIDVGKFVDTRFAEIACRSTGFGKRRSSVRDVSKIAMEILDRQAEGRSTKTMLGKEGKYLFFTLNDQEYGIGIFSVKEVIRMMPIRSVPQAPSFVKGVINLRGKVIPLMDLGARFGLGDREYGERACIIVLEIEEGSRIFHVGILVDSVSEVVNIKAQDVEETLCMCGIEKDYIHGMAKMNNGVKILLNAAHLFSEQEAEVFQSVA